MGILELELNTVYVEPEVYAESAIEVLDSEGGIVYIGFPEEDLDDMAYVAEYLDRYGAGGFWYPPNTYPLATSEQHKHDLFKPVPEELKNGVSFETLEQLLVLMYKSGMFDQDGCLLPQK